MVHIIAGNNQFISRLPHNTTYIKITFGYLFYDRQLHCCPNIIYFKQLLCSVDRSPEEYIFTIITPSETFYMNIITVSRKVYHTVSKPGKRNQVLLVGFISISLHAEPCKCSVVAV